MSLRFYHRFPLVPGVRLNLSKRGASMSFGGRGAWYTFGTSGQRATVGIPGTGLFWTERVPTHASAARFGHQVFYFLLVAGLSFMAVSWLLTR